MNIYQELLGLKFKKLDSCKAWEKSVTCYKVFDERSNEFMGLFYLDLYPREGKYNHAAVFPLVQRSVVGDDIKRAAAAMVVNFDTAKEGQPSLMVHSNVKTFFHEFGHVMHNMCSKANYARFSGTAVERDFVELPSQMLENWTWDPTIMKRLSSHYKTGEPMPDELI
jgi:Zn-dependent oligopeptidase